MAATTGRANSPPEPEPIKSVEAHCAGGECQACDGLRFRISGEPAATRDRYQAECTRGDASTCAFLGDWIFEHGLTAQKRLGDHLAWFRRSCRAGSRYGCERYAWSLPESKAREALAVHEDLCKRGWAPSCMSVGSLPVQTPKGGPQTPRGPRPPPAPATTARGMREEGHRREDISTRS